MALPDWMGEFLRPLEVEQIPYAVTGSVASMVYGEIRLTADIDIVIWITPEDLPKVETLALSNYTTSKQAVICNCNSS